MRWYSRFFRPILKVRRRAEQRRRLRIESLESRTVPAITGAVFNDVNGDGIRGAEDTGVAGVTVQLFRAGSEMDSTETGIDGTFRFGSLAETEFQLRIDTTQSALDGLTLVPTDQGSDDAVDSDARLTETVATIDFTTDASNTDVAFDAGFAATAAGTLTLGDLVFNDADDSGSFDEGESGVAGVVVELLDETGETVLDTTTTATDGHYTFTGLADGTYHVRLAAGNFSGTGALVGFTPSTLASDDPEDDFDADSNGVLSGTLGEGGFIIGGPITLGADAEPTDDGDTNPNTNLALDFGVVAPAAAGTVTLGNQVFNDANDNGTFDEGESGVGGVVVELLDETGETVLDSTTTAADGHYFFTELADGIYHVRLAPSNFTGSGALVGFTPTTTAVTDPEDDVDADSNGIVEGTLGEGGFIISGPIVLAAGEEPTDDEDTDPDTNLSVDFGVVTEEEAPADSLAGRVFLDFNNSGTFDGPDTGIAGVTMTLSGGDLTAPVTAQTDAGGNFIFTDLAAGTYTLTQTQPTTPANQDGTVTAGTGGGTTTTVNVVNGIVIEDGDTATGYLFAEVPLVSTGGTVFQDTNGNGELDTGEAGIPGVTITLSGTSVVDGAITPVTATTNAQGVYTFTDLTPGTYTIAETQPTGFTDGAEQNGTPAAATVTNDSFAGIDLTSTAAASTGFNFGEASTATETGSIGGEVFVDANGDGIRQTSESGIAGVTIRLTGTDNQSQAVDRTTTTNSTGSFTFTGVVPGTYTLVETQPASHPDGTDTAGSAGGNATATNDTISGIVLEAEQVATGYQFGEGAATTGGGSISGAVFVDANNDGVRQTGEAGIAGVTIRLTGTDDESQAVDRTATTDTTGAYTFTGVAAGTYTLVETQPASNPDGTDTPGSAGGNANVTANTISGIELDADETATGYLFGEGAAAAGTGSISGAVYVDANNDGVRQTGEAGIAGVTIRLTGTDDESQAVDRTATTDTTGAYTFTGVAAGTYTLAETQPASNPDGTDTPGSAGGNANVTANTISGIVLDADETATGYLFGEGAATQPPSTDAPNLAITQAISSNFALPGSTVTITYTVRNRGTTPVSGVSAEPELGGLTFVSASSSDFDADTGTWSVGDLAAGATETLRIIARVPALGSFRATVQATVDGGESAAAPVSTGVAAGTVAGATPRFWFLSSGWTTLRGLGPVGTGSRSTATTPPPSNGTGPTTPTLTLAPASDTGTPGDNSTNLATVTLTGTTTAGATVTLVQTGATATASSTGAFTFTGVALTVGANPFTVTATNTSGTSTGTATITRVDSTSEGPATPTLTLAAASDTGTPGDGSTDLATVTLTGTTTAGATVTLAPTGATATADTTGAFSFTGVALTVGPNAFTVTATNSSGTSTGTATITRVDSTSEGPATPTLALAAASDTGTPGDGSTDLATVTLTGTTTAGANVTLAPTGATATADTTGAFSFTGVALTVGANAFTVTATNSSGTSTGTATFTRVESSTENATPTVATTLSPISLAVDATRTVDLAGTFDDADIANSTVRFDTSGGAINVELFDRQAPKTVANFLNYLNDGDYADSIFHRSAKLLNGNPFVLQGGGFTFETSPAPNLVAVPTDPQVQNEPDPVNRSNLRGTIAMAKVGNQPNSATSQFFFNLGDNTALNTNNEGFTVFGRVVGEADQTIVDALAAIATQDHSEAVDLPANQMGVFDEIPLTGYTGTDFPTDTARSNYAIINGVSIVNQPEALTYTVVGNTEEAVADATIENNRLTIHGHQAGTTTLTIQATDKSGATVTTTVTVTAAA